MSLASACVDRARIVRKEATGARVEGRTSFAPVSEQWFKARLFENASNDVQDPAGGHFSSVNAVQVLTVARDLDGSTLAFQGDFIIDVNSREFGRFLWRMQGEPEPLRKKRRVIGWLLNVERVVEREYEDILNSGDDTDVGPPGV